VKYRPSRLYCDQGVWLDADLGEPNARWIVGHEIGHLVLHDYHAKAFSSDPTLRIKFDEKEYSAEWQADTFVSHLYLPDELLRNMESAEEAAIKFGVPLEFAVERWNTFTRVYQKKRKLAGDLCSRCGDLLSGENGMLMICRTCSSVF